jgi:hypothetical protein
MELFELGDCKALRFDWQGDVEEVPWSAYIKLSCPQKEQLERKMLNIA